MQGLQAAAHALYAARMPGCEMRAWEHVSSFGGVLTLGRDLLVAVDMVQGAEVVAPANGGPFRLELKSQQRAAPFLVFEGSEQECRNRLGQIAEAIRRERERRRIAELRAITSTGVVT